MLAVQVDFWKLQENKRHNVVTEQQNARSLDIQQQDANTREFSAHEQKRHNLVVEEQGWASIHETGRHNQVTEQLQSRSNDIAAYNAESNRMNAMTNAAEIPIMWFNAETQRSSVQNEYQLKSKSNEIAERNANTAEKQAQIQWLSVIYGDYNTSASVDINRQKVENDYQLGVQSNDIRQQEANTHQEQLDLGKQQLDLQKREFTWRIIDDSADKVIKGARVIKGGNYHVTE